MNKLHIFYLCDRKACANCSWPECKHTQKPRHAINAGKILKGIHFSMEVVPSRGGNTEVYLIEKEEKESGE